VITTASRRRGHPHFRQPSRVALRRRRRGAGAVGLLLLVAGAIALALGPLGDELREITLPLRHDDIIRQQSRDKGVDAALIAAVIYQESKFRDQTSRAGARGLMQITPATAHFIAKKSGGSAFTQDDLATPQINISYGTFYLRYLLDHYDRNEELVIAAYNAGLTNVDGWVRKAGGPGAFDSVKDIPFPETREYVRGVQKHRDMYRHRYDDELGY
jgi:soluble lytic murein transglycosylase